MRLPIYRACLLLLLPCAALAMQVQEDPLERQVLEIGKELRCTVCQNQPVSESNADLARDMRAIIREQLQAGKSRDEILRYFVERYGNYVLLKPRFDPFGALLWIAPLTLLALLSGFAYFYMRARVKPLPPTAPALSAEDAARVRVARSQDRT